MDEAIRQADIRGQQHMKRRVINRFYRDNIAPLSWLGGYWSIKPGPSIEGLNPVILMHKVGYYNLKEVDEAFHEASKDIMWKPYRCGYTVKQCLEDLEDHPAIKQLTADIYGEEVTEMEYKDPGGEVHKLYSFRTIVRRVIVRTFARHYKLIDKADYIELYRRCREEMVKFDPEPPRGGKVVDVITVEPPAVPFEPFVPNLEAADGLVKAWEESPGMKLVPVDDLKFMKD